MEDTPWAINRQTPLRLKWPFCHQQTRVDIPVEPLEHCLEDVLLAVALEVIARHELNQLALSHGNELLSIDDILELLQGELLCLQLQLGARVHLGEALDPEAVILIHMLGEILAAGIPHWQDLEQVGGGEQTLLI